ncbi:MAG: response regulator [Candidatus Electrothrix sp. AR3]|nr:response regulator [Candidatus Electrothrix sp. AR3]
MKVIFCEECGGRNTVQDKRLEDIDNQPLTCQICANTMSRETIIPHHTSSATTINTLHYHLLLIDDDVFHLQLMKTTLEKEYTVSIASTGVHGLDLAVERQPDLILLDLNMPGMDGYEVCRRLKENSATRKIAVIFVSARDHEDDEYRGFTLGAVDYINKPINLQILHARITVQLRIKQLLEQQKKQSDSLIQSLHQNNMQVETEQERLQQENNNFLTILDSIQEQIIIEDAQKRIFWVNRPVLNFCEMAMSEVIGKQCQQIFKKSGAGCEECLFPQGANRQIEEEQDFPEQTFIHLPFFNEEGKPCGIAHILPVKTEEHASDTTQLCQAAESAINSFIDRNRKAIRESLATILFGIDAISSILRDNKELEMVSRPVAKAAEQLDHMVCSLLDFQQTDKDD